MRGGFARRRPLLRAAVVGGGAYMAGRAAANRSAQEADQEAYQDQRLSDLEAQQQPQSQQQAPVPEPRPESSMIGQLNQLVQLHDAGALSDEEFAAAKSKLLG